MSSNEAETTLAKLQALSEERASKVLSLIEDLTELEALENAEDLKDALSALAELKSEAIETQPASPGKVEFANDKAASGTAIPYEQLRRELGLGR